MGRVALVNPYFRTRSPTEILLPPLGCALLKAQLSSRGIESRIFDCTFSSAGRILRLLRGYTPDIVGIYSMVTFTRMTFAIAEAVRRSLPDAILAAGGPLPTVYPDRFRAAFDAVFRGEADVAFPAFCADALGRGLARDRLSQLPLQSYEGLFMAGGAALVDNPVAHHDAAQIDSFPLPDRGDFDHAAYQAAWRAADGTRTASLMTTLGCPYGCDFCSKPVFGTMYRERSLDRVFQEIDEIRNRGYDTLWIADDSFTLSVPRVREFCRRMAGRGMRWTCLSRVTGMDAATAALMRASGCSRVYLGLESGDPEALRIMNKHARVEDGVKAVELYRGAGIEAAAFFLVGYPGESVASIEETFRLSLSLPLDDISFNVPFPLPGSPLFERVSGLDPTMDWSAENEVTFVYQSEFDRRWLERRIKETVRSFERSRRRRTPGPT